MHKHIFNDFHHTNHHDLHDFHNDKHVTELTKSAEIKDDLGNTRYRIFLTDFDDETNERTIDLTKFSTSFQVTVLSYFYTDEAVTIVQKQFNIFDEAYKFFNDCINNYAHLVKAESRDFNDINIYAEKIGYHKICPSCCANCKFAEQHNKDNRIFKDKCDKQDKLICTNIQYLIDKQETLVPDFPPEHHLHCDRPHPDHHRIHDNVHKHYTPRHCYINIRPEVDFNGICDYYESK